MQDILDVLISRKSIRRYKPDPVPNEMIDKILEAARWTPTGENYQPWRFIVITDPETKNKIGDLAKVGWKIWFTGKNLATRRDPKWTEQRTSMI